MSDGSDPDPIASPGEARWRVRVTGVVQGVGFRPFVYRLATALGLTGWVGNDAAGVLAEVEGPAPAVAAFVDALTEQPPPAATVTSVSHDAVAPVGDTRFRIAPSAASGIGDPGASSSRTWVPPDIAICDACTAELFDPSDRRHRHPFITCTDCGPRFTIIESLPYDRPATTMADFALCEACTTEYADPADRRYHAQPICCGDCGPRLEVWRPAAEGAAAERVDLPPGFAGDEAALARAVAALAAGRVVGVKGIGGYHLAVRADDEEAVQGLRDRKQRGDKPFAVLVRDLAVARQIAVLGDDEAAVLASPARPIVLVRRRDAALGGSVRLASGVAPGNPFVGLVLPYTGLHHLLVADGPAAIVLTSGNVSDEPIVHDDATARRVLLGHLADLLVAHDRPIHLPCDDSVVRVVDGAVVPVRRSRGYAPLPVALPVPVAPTLAAGGDLKGACCVASGERAWMSQHLGDLGTLPAVEALDGTARDLLAFHGVEPERVVADGHPAYRSRRWAEAQAGARGAELVRVQHHRAHVAAAMVEHGIGADVEVTGIAMDGTGYGDDGTIWGGELLRGTYARLERLGHVEPWLLPGGDATVRHPARVAVSLLLAAGIEPTEDLPPVAALGQEATALVRRQVERQVHTVATSSMGRLFDAVASLLDLHHEVSFEAQAAMALEAAAADGRADPRSDRSGELDLRFDLTGGVASPAPVVRGVVDGWRAGRPVPELAAAFHDAVVDLVVGWARHADRPIVVLSGGVFQNVELLRRGTAALRSAGFDVRTHRVVPANDGGLALGQVVLGQIALGEASRAGVGADDGRDRRAPVRR